MWFVNILFWLKAFFCPVILAGLIGFGITSDISFPALIIGGVMGIILAEYIRRNIGLSTFFGRVYGPNEMDEKLKKRED